ncbi:hypothetical protein HD554DRAFT_1188115 [Boletus coccyginus]|nr:hypothetical protein HD554DRAFT_1188115 [Boletus coccyginus]
MAVDDEQRTLLNKQLLAAARQQGNVDELLTSPEYRDDDDDFLFDINCVDLYSGNTPLHLAVSSGSVDNVNSLIEAYGCDVDPTNKAGDTPLHLAVQIQDQDTRRAIVSALVETAGAIESIRLTNKAGQTPNDLSKIYCPKDTEVSSLTTPPARQMDAFLDPGDIASDGEGADSD